MSTTTTSIIGIIFVMLVTIGAIIYYAWRKNEYGDRIGYTWQVLMAVVMILAYGINSILFVIYVI